MAGKRNEVKYRLTLRLDSAKLTLTVSGWHRQEAIKQATDLIATQIIEDFTTIGYFTEMVRKLFADASSFDPGDPLVFCWPFSESVRDSVISRVNTLASPHRYGKTAKDITGLIGNTPMVKLNSLDAGCKATVLVKLESLEPNSVKDRVVHSILSRAIERGEVKEETEVIEASSGNVAFALAAILKVMLNKKPKIFISKMHGSTKIRAVRVSGVPVVLTGKKQGTRSAKEASLAYAKSKRNVFQLNQHGNPDNPRAHRFSTGPELYHQCHIMTGQAPAEFVTGLGSGGTAVGVAMFRKDIGETFRVIGVEPAEASLLTGTEFHPHRFSGLAPGFITGVISRNRDGIDHVETVTWQEGFNVCRRLLIEEGFLVGASSGASIAAALRRAKLPENEGKVIVTIAHDRGERYLGIDDLFVPPPEASETDVDEQ